MAIPIELLKHAARWAAWLSDEECEIACRGMIDRTYKKNDYICHQGGKFNVWAGVLTGLVKISLISCHGKQLSLIAFADGSWFGEGSLIRNEVRRYDIIAMRSTRLILMDENTFNYLQNNSFGFNKYLVRQLNDRLSHFVERVDNEQNLDATQRVACALGSLFNPRFNPGIGNSVALNQEEIGLLSGLSRQSANKALRELESKGLIEVRRGTIVINDWKDLVAQPDYKF